MADSEGRTGVRRGHLRLSGAVLTLLLSVSPLAAEADMLPPPPPGPYENGYEQPRLTCRIGGPREPQLILSLRLSGPADLSFTFKTEDGEALISREIVSERYSSHVESLGDFSVVDTASPATYLISITGNYYTFRRVANQEDGESALGALAHRMMVRGGIGENFHYELVNRRGRSFSLEVPITIEQRDNGIAEVRCKP